jgi:NADH:ubiquinone oxidoreductase subunit 3 (subunit A)
MEPIEIIVIIAAVALVFGVAIGSFIKKKKARDSGQSACGGCCGGCPYSSGCHSQKTQTKNAN